MDRLKAYAELLADWNARHNLVSDRSLADVWKRHFWDSAQIIASHPGKRTRSLVDLGSGAGFPGLVLAELRPELRMTLIEATRKKYDFLKVVAGESGPAADIRNERIEEVAARAFDVITARACAPLPAAALLCTEILGLPGSRALLHKGQNLASELTEAA